MLNARSPEAMYRKNSVKGTFPPSCNSTIAKPKVTPSAQKGKACRNQSPTNQLSATKLRLTGVWQIK